MPKIIIHKLMGNVGVKILQTPAGERRVLSVDTKDGDIYEIEFDAMSASKVAKELSPGAAHLMTVK